MNALVTLLVAAAAASSVVATPLVLRHYPLNHYNYRYAASPYIPVVRHVISTVPDTVHYRAYRAPTYVGIKTQYHDQDLLGQARYGHTEPGQSHHAVQDAFGNKIGSFSHYSPDGKVVQTNYVADAAGYRASVSDIPIGTPEVLALTNYRGKRDLSPFLNSNPRFTQDIQQAYPTTNLQPIVTQQGFLQETPEVQAATADHFARVADSKARIAALERSSVNGGYQGQFEHVQNNYVPTSHRTLPTSNYQSFDYQYNQPTYQTSGINQETPDVLAAKAKHYAELAANKARTATLVEPFQQVQSSVVPISNSPVAPTNQFQSFNNYRYNKPAIPHAYPTTNLAVVVTRDGYIEETPEVLAAKANHFAQHASAKARIFNV